MFILFLLMSAIVGVIVGTSHNCVQYSRSTMAHEMPNPSGSSFLEASVRPEGYTFNFNVTLDGTAGYTCLDLGPCTANVGGTASSLYISYQETGNFWASDLAIVFYGTGQSFGGCCGTAGSCSNTQIGSFPSQYNAWVKTRIQVNVAFSPALQSGFTAVCAINTCGSGTCQNVKNTFFGTFVLSNIQCGAPPTTTGHPIFSPITAPTAPSVAPSTALTPGPSVTPSTARTSGPSVAPSTARTPGPSVTLSE